jgi:hypothetical protein
VAQTSTAVFFSGPGHDRRPELDATVGDPALPGLPQRVQRGQLHRDPRAREPVPNPAGRSAGDSPPGPSTTTSSRSTRGGGHPSSFC